MPRYLVTDNHPAIIPRDKFNAVQMEIARRGSKHKRSTLGVTDQGKYSGKFALSELLICGECGCSYCRTGKTKNGKRQHVWRCINRRDHGAEVCDAIGAEEQKLHAAILRCLNKLFSKQDETMRLIQSNLRFAVTGQGGVSEVYLLEKQIISLQEEAESLMTMMNTTGGDTEKYMRAIEDTFKKVKTLRQQLEVARCKNEVDSETQIELRRITEMIQKEKISFDTFDDIMIRRLVECVRVMKDKRIIVVLKGGMQAEDVLA